MPGLFYLALKMAKEMQTKLCVPTPDFLSGFSSAPPGPHLVQKNELRSPAGKLSQTEVEGRAGTAASLERIPLRPPKPCTPGHRTHTRKPHRSVLAVTLPLRPK